MLKLLSTPTRPCCLQPIQMMALLLALLLQWTSLPLAPGLGNGSPPRIHFAPPCFSDTPPHDIAAAVWHPESQVYHVFPGCWHSGGWQHIQSKDLVSWETVGKPTSFGGSGGIVLDEAGAAVAFANSVSAWISNSTELVHFTPLGRLINQPGGGDPVLWKDERDSRWYAITANGRGGSTKNPGGCGVEEYWVSPKLHGDGAAWKPLPAPFLKLKGTVLPRVGAWVRPREFVTPDFFPLGAPTAATAWVFLTTEYGECGGVVGATSLPGCGGAQGGNFSRTFDYAGYYIGDRPKPGAPFAPDAGQGVWDWSPFVPAAAGGEQLEFATSKGMEQFGCCPKTSAGPAGRRVLFGWINNGWDQGEPWVEPDRPKDGPLGRGTSNNTLSLPRDLSVGYSGNGSRFVKQAFIPELKTLRRAHTTLPAQSVPTSDAAEPHWLPETAFGPQIEIFATFVLSASAVHQLQEPGRDGVASAPLFGLTLLASNASVVSSFGVVRTTAAVGERTVIAFDLSRKMVRLDRRSSGASVDADVRAGPWPDDGSGSSTNKVTVHAFVDHAVVSLIVGNQTAISAWVAPQRADSVGVGVFSELGPSDVTATVDVWQLATPKHLVPNR